MNEYQLRICQLIGCQPGPLGLPTLNDTDRHEEQAASIVKDRCGVSLKRWDKLTESKRLYWLEKAIDICLNDGSPPTVDEPFDVKRSDSAARQMESVLGKETKEILDIARSKKSADDKMRAICGVDRSYLARDSQQWAVVLGVSDGAIRKTKFWKEDRDKAVEAAG